MPSSDSESKRPAVTERTVRIVRWTLLGIVVAVLLLIFAVPRKVPAAASLADPNEAFIDRAGLVSSTFARQWAGALLNDPLFEFVIYTDARPPEGDVVGWTTSTASEWKIGKAKEERGLVLFVFKEPRIARVEVGYGLEGKLTDARMRRLLEDNLSQPFAVGQFERGFDAFIKAVRDELGGAAASARAMEAWVKEPSPGVVASILAGYQRLPRMVVAVVSAYLEAEYLSRFVILVFTTITLGIAALGLGALVNTVWRLARIPAIRREYSSAAARIQALKLGEIIIGPFAFAICFALVGVVLMNAEDFLGRRGNFSGAGAGIVWPAG